MGGDLNPGGHLLDIQGQVPGRLQHSKGQDTLLSNTRFLRIQLRYTLAGTGLKPETLLRHDPEGTLLFARFTQAELRDGPVGAGLDPWPDQAQDELLLAVGFG